MNVNFGFSKLFSMQSRWFPAIFFSVLMAISRACAAEAPLPSSPVLQAQRAAEENIDRVVQFRHLEGIREIFGHFSRANGVAVSKATRTKRTSFLRKMAEEELARVIENPNSLPESTLLQSDPLLEAKSTPDASIGVWFLWGFGAGARTGYDSYKMPEISWPGEEERALVREDSFKPIALKDQENFLCYHHIQRSAANAFMLGFRDGWSEGAAVASKDFPQLQRGEHYDCPCCTPAPGAERRIASLKRLITSRAKALDVKSDEASEVVNQIDCSWKSFAYLFEKPVERYSPADMEILKLAWGQIMSSKDVTFLVDKLSYVPAARGETLEHIQQAALDDAVAGRPRSAPVVMAHAGKNELNHALLSNIFRTLADKLLLIFEARKSTNDKEQHLE